jgi:Flp pilus assembly protein TadG
MTAMDNRPALAANLRSAAGTARQGVRHALRHRWAWLRRAGDKGSATVEFVILVPLLIALVLFVALCGRLVTAQLDLDAAAHGAARAASIDRTVPAATADARQAALDTLTARGVTCGDPMVNVNTDNLRPGGVVTVTVSCAVPLGDLTLLGVGGSRTVTATSSSPIDVWRGGAS